MTSSSATVSSEEPATAVVAGRPLSPLWITVGEACARWALWATVLVSGLLGAENDVGLGRPLSFVLLAFLGLAFVSLGDGLVSLLWRLLTFLLPKLRLAGAAQRLQTIPPAMIGRLLGVFFYIAGDMLWPESIFQYIKIPPVGEMAIVLLTISGGLLALARHGHRSQPGRLLLRGTTVVLNAAFLAWVVLPGTDTYLAQPAALPSSSLSASLSNPGRSGPHDVETLSYGSGGDRRRPEFAAMADLRTEPVDGAAIFPGYPGLGGRYFRWYWGFDFSQLPLNGQVWYPQGDGPFPLVLIVHGNHAATEPSDTGYAYLAEHLASQGYIAVTVDENFLNGMLFFDGEMAEMPLRAWLLLKHLQVWRGWNDTPGNPFYKKVDLERVALIGHSRGGEAVAAAAEMNWYVAPPVSEVSSRDEFQFGIGAVVAIAPSDGHYTTAGRAPSLSHSDYLLLAGGHDADTYVLYGQAQYNRVRFNDNPNGFKALAYLYQANHGQFNTLWGNRDRGWLNSLLLNRRPLLAGAAQQQNAKVFVTAFLNASLRGEDDYRILFANPATGNDWLPEGIVVTQYAEDSFVAIDTNQPRSRPERLDIRDGHAWTQEMSAWETKALRLRDGKTPQQNEALYLAWQADSKPQLGMDLDEGIPVAAGDALTFALAPAADEATPIAVTVELEATTGETARLSLSQFGPVYPPLPARLLKADWLLPLPGYEIELATPYERVLQTYTLPLAAFTTNNPRFRPAEIQAIRFIFDGSAAAALYLDQVGFVSPQAKN